MQVGGVYMYSNLFGCDGERVYYDGCCIIALNGEILSQVRIPHPHFLFTLLPSSPHPLILTPSRPHFLLGLPVLHG